MTGPKNIFSFTLVLFNIFLVILSLLFQHIPGNFQSKDLFSQFSQAVIKSHSSTSWSHLITSLFLRFIVPIMMFSDSIIFPAFSWMHWYLIFTTYNQSLVYIWKGSSPIQLDSSFLLSLIFSFPVVFVFSCSALSLLWSNMKGAFRWTWQTQPTTLNREKIASSVHHKSENVSQRKGEQAEALTGNGERQRCLRRLMLFRDVSEIVSSCSTSLLLLRLMIFFPTLFFCFPSSFLYYLTDNLSSGGNRSCLLQGKWGVAWRIDLVLSMTYF